MSSDTVKKLGIDWDALLLIASASYFVSTLEYYVKTGMAVRLSENYTIPLSSNLEAKLKDQKLDKINF